MYYPYLRGKQYELILARENASLISRGKIIPILEPVRISLSGIIRTVESLIEHKSQFVVIINPQYGELIEENTTLKEKLFPIIERNEKFLPGYILTGEPSDEDNINELPDGGVAIIHQGSGNGREIAAMLENIRVEVASHIFIEGKTSSKLYQRHFSSEERVLIRDGFERKRNKDYGEKDFFSELHLTYAEENMTGFGDFLIVGDEFSETGGPAYAVAIHLTYIDDDDEKRMYVRHYKSDMDHSPVDPAGKFQEALSKLVADVKKKDTKILHTEAVDEFNELYERKHFPGLGYVKKLSMQHHLEIIGHYLIGLK